MFKTTNRDLTMGYITKILTECVNKLSYQASSWIVRCKDDDKRDRDCLSSDDSLLASAHSSLL